MADQSDTTTQHVPEMVERVARYLFDACAGLFLFDSPIEPKWTNASPMRQLFFRTVAAGVIGEAMREPTEAMVHACGSDDYYHSYDDIRTDWETMIDAALKD